MSPPKPNQRLFRILHFGSPCTNDREGCIVEHTTLRTRLPEHPKFTLFSPTVRFSHHTIPCENVWIAKLGSSVRSGGTICELSGRFEEAPSVLDTLVNTGLKSKSELINRLPLCTALPTMPNLTHMPFTAWMASHISYHEETSVPKPPDVRIIATHRRFAGSFWH